MWQKFKKERHKTLTFTAIVILKILSFFLILFYLTLKEVDIMIKLIKSYVQLNNESYWINVQMSKLF